MGKIKILTMIVLAVLLLSIASTTSSPDKPVCAQASLESIVIQPDGSISPSGVPIICSGDTYTFTGDIYGAIKIFKSNIVLDGAGYTLTGSFRGNTSDIWIVGNGPTNFNSVGYYTIGVDLGNSSINNITVKNLNVENFSIGMYIWTQNNTITGNGVGDSSVGILMTGANSTLTYNYIADNTEGLFFGFNTSGSFPPGMHVYFNSFVKNNVQLSGCQCKNFNLSESVNYWDNGKFGNYWSNYNGTDLNKDHVGDTPYVIDVLDVDRYPLMQSPASPPIPASQSPIPIAAIVVGVSVPLAAVACFLAFRQIRRHSAGKEKT